MTSADGPMVGDHVAPTSVGWDVIGRYVGFAVGGAVGGDVAGLEVGSDDGDPVGREVAGAAVGAADGDGDGAVVGGALGVDDAMTLRCWKRLAQFWSWKTGEPPQ